MNGELELVDSSISTLEGGTLNVQAVDLAYVKQHVRALGDVDSDLLQMWIDAAASYFFEQTGRSPITQTRVATLDAFPFFGAHGSWARIELPHPPLQAVTSVSYVNASGTLVSFDDGASPATPFWTTTAPTGDYGRRGTVEPLYGMTWPSARHQSAAVQITYRCGYGDTPDNVPKLVRQVICFLVAHFEQFRSAVHEARHGSVLELPYGVQYMMDAFKFSAMPSQLLRRHRWPAVPSEYIGPGGFLV